MPKLITKAIEILKIILELLKTLKEKLKRNLKIFSDFFFLNFQNFRFLLKLQELILMFFNSNL